MPLDVEQRISERVGEAGGGPSRLAEDTCWCAVSERIRGNRRHGDNNADNWSYVYVRAPAGFAVRASSLEVHV